MNDTQNTQQNTIISWLQATPFRKNILMLIFVFIALMLITKTVLLFRQAMNVGQADNYPQSIIVTGKAEDYVKPDTLQFNISINEDGKDVGDATKKVSEKSAKALVILKANGVEEKNIKTTNWTTSDKYESVSTPCNLRSLAPQSTQSIKVDQPYAPYPVVPCTNTSSEIVGATVYQTLEIKIQDIEKNATNEKRGKIIAELAAADIKTDGFVFTVFDLDSAKTKVRAKAIEKAKEDARVLVRNLGVRLGDIVGFTESDGGYIPYMSARADTMMVTNKEGGVAPQPQLPTGEQKVSSSVTITYLLK